MQELPDPSKYLVSVVARRIVLGKSEVRISFLYATGASSQAHITPRTQHREWQDRA